MKIDVDAPPCAVPRCAQARPYPRPPPPPKFSESRRRSVDDRPPRDPWHPSAARCDPRSTAAACPRSRSYPRPPPPKFSESRSRSVDDRPPRAPWHLTSGRARSHCRGKVRTSRSAADEICRAQSFFEPAGASWRTSCFMQGDACCCDWDRGRHRERHARTATRHAGRVRRRAPTLPSVIGNCR